MLNTASIRAASSSSSLIVGSLWRKQLGERCSCLIHSFISSLFYYCWSVTVNAATEVSSVPWVTAAAARSVFPCCSAETPLLIWSLVINEDLSLYYCFLCFIKRYRAAAFIFNAFFFSSSAACLAGVTPARWRCPLQVGSLRWDVITGWQGQSWRSPGSRVNNHWFTQEAELRSDLIIIWGVVCLG